MKKDEDLKIFHSEDAKVISFEEFKSIILNDKDSSGINKISDMYAKIPNVIRKTTNLDPTGIASYFDGLLSDNKAKREQDRILTAIYGMYNAFIQYEIQLKENIERDKEQYLDITELCLEKAKDSFQKEKIKYFVNIWANSIFNIDRTFSEKECVFQLISNLTVDHIKIIKVVYDEMKHKKSIEGHNFNSENETGICVSAKEIEEKLKLNGVYIQQICTDLQGRGMLRYPRGGIIVVEPTNFLTTTIVELLDLYISNNTI